jgi:cellobiose-specific phosphotransferase system component IIA
MNKSLIKIGLLIGTTTLIGIGTVIANSSSRVLATPAEAKMHLDEGIKALQGGDTNGAMTHLKAADDKLSAGQAKMHLDEGIKALQGGDTNGAMTHVKAAESALSG